jgi:pSer/pThr/pTyr-binding forkhead associated (FHA) protein
MSPVHESHPNAGRMQVNNTIRLVPFGERNCLTQASRLDSASHISADGVTYIGIGLSDTELRYRPQGNVLCVGIDTGKTAAYHCEIWRSNEQWYIKDVKSTLGTFLNYVRLSKPDVESSAYLVHDGDIIQLGQSHSSNGERLSTRRFIIRIESSDKHRNEMETPGPTRKRKTEDNHEEGPKRLPSDCSICLRAVLQSQALVVAPCRHTWHYSCIQNSIQTSTSRFLCPNCLENRLSVIANRPKHLMGGPRHLPLSEHHFLLDKWHQLLETTRQVIQRQSALKSGQQIPRSLYELRPSFFESCA